MIATKIVTVLITCIKNTPVYPHWLEFRNAKLADADVLPFFKGEVLETGCGNGEKMEWFMKNTNKIKKYVATDYEGWNKQFKKHTNLSSRFGLVTVLLYGRSWDKNILTEVCDALNLPYKDNSFDTYCSFEVLEHIDKADQFISEASRVLKKNGYCIISTPFVYREHGLIKQDIQRFTRGGYMALANRHKMKVKKIITYSTFGTTLAGLSNQWMVRKISESMLLIKIPLFILSPLYFALFNIAGYLLELIDNDERFAFRYHIVMQKKLDKRKGNLK